VSPNEKWNVGLEYWVYSGLSMIQIHQYKHLLCLHLWQLRHSFYNCAYFHEIFSQPRLKTSHGCNLQGVICGSLYLVPIYSRNALRLTINNVQSTNRNLKHEKWIRFVELFGYICKGGHSHLYTSIYVDLLNSKGPIGKCTLIHLHHH